MRTDVVKNDLLRKYLIKVIGDFLANKLYSLSRWMDIVIRVEIFKESVAVLVE